jgi:hypothetical protein
MSSLRQDNQASRVVTSRRSIIRRFQVYAILHTFRLIGRFVKADDFPSPEFTSYTSVHLPSALDSGHIAACVVLLTKPDSIG